MGIYTVGGIVDEPNTEADWILPYVPLTPTEVVAEEREQAREQAKRIERSARRIARRETWTKMLARTACTLLSIFLLVYGATGMIDAGVDLTQYGMQVAALVMGGGCLVALVYALTES